MRADVVEFAEQMANLGKIVIVSALDGTFERKVGAWRVCVCGADAVLTLARRVACSVLRAPVRRRSVRFCSWCRWRSRWSSSMVGLPASALSAASFPCCLIGHLSLGAAAVCMICHKEAAFSKRCDSPLFCPGLLFPCAHRATCIAVWARRPLWR